MLLLDLTNLSVYEVEDSTVHTHSSPPCMRFDQFESISRSAFCGVFLAAKFPECRVGTETLSFIGLPNGGGWAWASRIRVMLAGELPIDAHTFGEEFLFLWPVPMAINAYINFKEKARWRALNGESQIAFFETVKAHPPSMAFVPHRGMAHGYGISIVREVPARDMTVAQRLFVGSLTPQHTPFLARTPCDKWCDSLSFRDKCHLDSFLLCGARSGRARGTGAAAAGPALDSVIGQFFLRLRRPAVELPDDLLGRIVCTSLAEHMASVNDLCAAVAALRGVCRQHRAVTDACVGRMLEGVVGTAHSLLTEDPCKPFHVQAVVSAAGLTLRHALSLSAWPNRWRAYVAMRRNLECRAGRAPDPVARQPPDTRRALLWNECTG